MKMNYVKRLVLETELRKGTPLAEIARMIGLHRNALYAEFKRTGMNRTNYDARKAQWERDVT